MAPIVYKGDYFAPVAPSLFPAIIKITLLLFHVFKDIWTSDIWNRGKRNL